MSSGSWRSSRKGSVEPRFWGATVLLFCLLVFAAIELLPRRPPPTPALIQLDIPLKVVPIEFVREGKININTAPAGKLEDLPGIGPALAARIIAYREEHGPFESLEDVVRVSGIGPATLEGFRERITVTDDEEE